MRATVYLTKTAAADRQLNAAIRMWVMEEDKLAIHSVASAAYGIFSDIQKKRGREEAAFQEIYGLLRTAQDLNDGSIQEDEVASWGQDALSSIEPIRKLLRDDPDFDIEAIQVSVPDYVVREFWRDKRKIANFLKHADRDERASINEEEIDNTWLLSRAIGSSLHLSCPLSAEKLFFHHVTVATGMIDISPHSSLSDEVDKFRGYDLQTLLFVGRQTLCYDRVGDLDRLRKG